MHDGNDAHPNAHLNARNRAAEYAKIWITSMRKYKVSADLNPILPTSTLKTWFVSIGSPKKTPSE